MTWSGARLRPASAALAALALVVGAATGAGAHDRRAPADAPGYRCVITPERLVDPVLVPRGGAASVRVEVGVACTDPRPLHVVLLIDASTAMDGGPLDAVQEALVAALRRAALGASYRIGVVAFGGREELGGAEVVSFLSEDRERLVSGMRGIEAGGEPCLTCGLNDAFIVLRSGRNGLPAEDLREVVLLASAGVDASGCEAVRGKAREILAHNVTLITACAGADCERRCVDEAASPRYAFRPSSWSEVALLLDDLGALNGAFHPVLQARLLDDPAPGFTFESPDHEIVVGGHVDYTLDRWPYAGLDISYGVRADACGNGPTSALAEIHLLYDDGREDAIALPNPNVEVSCVASATPAPTPSATAPPPSATATRTGQVRGAARAYLPWLALAGCPTRRPVDVALVLDVSGSMAAPWDPYASRWHGVRAYGAAVLAALRPTDRSAVLAFAGNVFVLGLPTGDHEASRQAVLTRLPRANGSRMDLALAVAVDLMPAPTPRRSARVLMVTDGDLNQTEVPDLRRAARQVGAAGVRLDVALLDADADFRLWRSTVGSDGVVRLLRPDAVDRAGATWHCLGRR